MYHINVFSKDSLFNNNYLDPRGPVKIISSNIPNNSTVLDIGCNSGLLGRLLEQKNCQVDGVDINKNALKAASKFYRHVYLRDLCSNKLNISHTYDVIVCSDVLEHLPNPDKLLQNISSLLKNNGYLWISLPNIARLELRILHLFGDFSYKKGIMSPDHLRFFTQKTGTELIQSSGYKIIQTYHTGIAQNIKIFPTLFSFQFVYKCVLKRH